MSWLRKKTAIAALAVALVCWSWAIAAAALRVPGSEASGAIVARPHPLPPALAGWHDDGEGGDYFSEVVPLDVGYLVWSRFPVTVYIEPLAPNLPRSRDWNEGVGEVVAEWSAYFPLTLVGDPEGADITIWSRRPPVRLSPTGELLRARSAQTRYQIGDRPDSGRRLLAHHCEIFLSPTQTGDYLKAAARHELGHALGIWGHSDRPSDVMYFSQVSRPPGISPRDLNTLQQIYRQPTCVGWPIPDTPTTRQLRPWEIPCQGHPTP
ncbi:matrixin family metalloprotease [Oxynema sp. CENA135]|uniref:matrixin family metalloprotease n=1 Tax=Oxynema sp. CENA135 TaxID=984206 RepID=UPI00190B119D|nr:matrixin family metalloprotease [Oxynema sp. CENA135]MBK4731208.1 matrixin family metalloprotease [Oxynema sp. CENA135]